MLSFAPKLRVRAPVMSELLAGKQNRNLRCIRG